MYKFESIDLFISALKDTNKPNSYSGYDTEKFLKNKFYVGNTCACKYDMEKNVLFVPTTSITPKCATYVKQLKAKLIAEFKCHVIHVPQWFYSDTRSHDFTFKSILKAFEDELTLLEQKHDIYTQKNTEKLLKELSALSDLTYEVPENLVNRYKTLLNSLKKIEENYTREVREFINSHTYYDIVVEAYFSKSVDIAFKTALRNYLNPTGEYAFLYIDYENGNVITSETICGAPKIVMNLEDSYNLSSAVVDGTIWRGAKYGNYTIMKVHESYIQIGCNKYTIQMIHEFYRHLVFDLGYKLK